MYNTVHGEAVTIEVKIGDYEQVFVLCKTNAPENYDGFNSVTVQEGSESRHVLVEKENLVWQESRYRSGLYTFEIITSKHNNPSLANWVRDRLFERLFGERS